MNIDEKNELKTNYINPILKEGYPSKMTGEKTFNDEFNNVLLNAIDPSLFISLNQGVQNYYEDFQDSEFEIYNFDTKEIEDVDAMFFLNAANKSDTMNLQIKDSLNIVDASNYKTMQVSKTLGDLIMKAQENNKTLRLDFDNQVTVVLKVSKEGKIDATFIPQDRMVENYLKNNIDYLKVRFDEQNIAYSNISYKPYKNQQNNKRNKGENK